MPKKKRVANPVILQCKHDPKDPEHVLCSMPQERSVVSSPEDRLRGSKSIPNVFIGAVNIGAEPVREYFRTRFERFYHPKFVRGRLHLVIDSVLVVFVVGLVATNLILWGKRNHGVVGGGSARISVFAARVQGVKEMPIPVTVDYSNAGSQRFVDASLILTYSSGITLGKVNDVRWDATSKSIYLGTLPPHGQGTLGIEVIPHAFGEQSVVALLQYKIEGDPKSTKYEQRTFVFLNVPVPTMHVQAFARYFSPEGDQIGRGPLPPKVGEVTKYKMYWVIEPGAYAFNQVRMEGVLGESVGFTDFIPVGKEEIQFDPLTRKVIWTPKGIASQYEGGAHAQGAIFEIALRPDESMSRKEVPLMANILVHATVVDDAGLVLESRVPSVTTALVKDSKAQGKSRVE